MSEEEWATAVDDALARLEKVDTAQELSFLLEGANDLDLPEEVVIPAFERLVSLSENAPEVLLRFAWRLEMISPDYDERAQLLRRQAANKDQ